jgi:bifunctional DNA-binding transcriptional regulator/antitoxin component of YhaV-PrlF toxin-antitoxin module
MKATGIDAFGCVVIPKEIRRTMRIREGGPSHNSLTLEEKFAIAVHSILKRYKEQAR